MNLGETLTVFLKAAFLSVNGSTTLALLKGDLVDRLQVLGSDQYAAAVAIGSASPGPLGYGAIALGFMAYGWPGAGIAALTSWLPAFLSIPLRSFYGLLEKRPWIAGVTWGVGAAGTGLLVVLILSLAQTSLTSWVSCGIFAICLTLLMRKLSAPAVLALSALLGACMLS